MSSRLFIRPCRNLCCFFPKQIIASRLAGKPSVLLQKNSSSLTRNLARNMSKDSNSLGQENKSDSSNDVGEIKKETDSSKKMTSRQRLSLVFAEYGVTAVVFHTAISLTSLGLCYVAVSSGLDIPGLLIKMGVSESISTSIATKGASTFVIAYACHKVFMPVRIFLTVTCTPLIVHRLRRIGLIK